MKLDKIARMISEDPDAKEYYDACPECGHVASVIGKNIECTNPNCAKYNDEYANTIRMLQKSFPEMVKMKGTLITKDIQNKRPGRTIEFIGLKDMGRYYVVFVPRVYNTRSKHYPVRNKHNEFSDIHRVFPLRVPSAGSLKRWIDLNAPEVFINREREQLDQMDKFGYYKGAQGGWETSHTAHTLTINKKNISKITLEQ
jgi:hypothetical protein